MTFSRPASSPGRWPFAPAELPPVDDCASATEALREKLTDAQTPGYQAEFDPEETERAGLFVEDALSEEFAPAEKRALLDGVIASREEPTLKPLWDDINERYAGTSLDMRAEEVIALQSEGIAPRHYVGNDQVQQRGQQSFKETCIARVRPM